MKNYCLKCGARIRFTTSAYESCSECGASYFIKDNQIKILEEGKQKGVTKCIK